MDQLKDLKEWIYFIGIVITIGMMLLNNSRNWKDLKESIKKLEQKISSASGEPLYVTKNQCREHRETLERGIQDCMSENTVLSQKIDELKDMIFEIMLKLNIDRRK